MLTSAETGIDTSAEAGAKPEITQEKVLKDFRYAKEKYKREVGNKPKAELTADEIFDLNAFNGAFETNEHRIGANFEKNRFTYTNKITNPNGGPDIEQEEGVPIEGMLNFLEKKLSISKSKAERDKIEEVLKTLKNPDVSKTYEEAHENQIIDIQPGETDDPIMFARKRQEALFASKDHRATGNMLENYNAGLATLKRRRELIIPPKVAATVPATGTGSTTAPIAAPPVTTAGPEGTSIIEAAEESEDDLADTEEDTAAVEDIKPAVAEGTGIPGDTILPETLETAEEDSEEENAPVTSEGNLEPEISTERGTNTTAQTRGRYEFGVIRDDDVIDKNASLQARKDFHERISKGRWFEFWRWPEKIALRLSEGGIENIQQEKLRNACIANGVSFLDIKQIKSAITEADRIQSNERQESLLERFAAGRIVKREDDKKPIIEEKVLLAEDSPLRAALLSDIIKPVVDGEITGSRTEQQKQIQEKLAAVIKKNLNDPKVKEIFGAEASDFGYVAEYFATDLLEKSLAVKEQMEFHKESLEQISAYIDIHIGIARDQSNTDTRNTVDRAVAWARSRQNDRMFTKGVQEVVGNRGWILNPAVVGIATSLATHGLLSSVGFGGRVAGIAAPIAGAMGGAVVAGARRYFEIGGDRRMQEAELSMGEVLPEKRHATDRIGKWMERAMGGYRREDLLQYRYDSVKTSDLINGSGEINNIFDTDSTNPKRTLKSVDQLLSQPLDIPAGIDDTTKEIRESNRKAVAERMEEIRLRINRGKRQKVDLLTFSDKTQVNQELNALYDAADKLEQALTASDADVAALKFFADTALNDAFDRDKKLKDNGFRGYRARQAAGAAVFGGTVGLAGALTTGVFLQHGAAEIARHNPGISKVPIIGGLFQPGQTALEKTAHNIGTVLGHPEIGTGPASVDTFKDMFDHGGRVNIGNTTLEANPDHTVTFFDRNTNQPLSNIPKTYLEADGKLIVPGNIGDLPGEMHSWAHSETFEHSIRQQIQEAMAVNEVTKIDIGELTVGIKGNEVHILTSDQIDPITGKLIPGQKPLIGTIDQNSNFHFTGATSEEISKVQAELAAHGFKTQVEDIPGKSEIKGVIDHFKEKGMVEKANRLFWHDNNTTMHLNAQGILVGARW
ncbi:MAG: hypothetical protein PHQ59_04380 [Candidatus Daviesbacteria bacterium]|nr:hypothetical protein [Candidatus Daviesbacteria bacterium]